jgi:hypothetical protein
VYRAYVAIRELMSLVFALMADSSAQVARFDSGGAAMELGAVAGAVTQALDGGGVERASISDAIPDRYVGDDAVYAALRRAHGIATVPLDQQIIETADYMRELAA